MVEEEEECFLPGLVALPEKVVMLSAGDSHTAALAESGQVRESLLCPQYYLTLSGLLVGNIQRQQRPYWPCGGHEDREDSSHGADRAARHQDRVWR